MALVELTKQLAQQAIGTQVKDVVDKLRPPDMAKIAESLTGDKTAPAAADSLPAAIAGQVQAMQRALKEDEELLVLCNAGIETLRVLEVFTPSPRLVVLIGIDTDRNITRVIAAAETVQLVCKVMKVQAGARPVRIRFIAPKT